MNSHPCRRPILGLQFTLPIDLGLLVLLLAAATQAAEPAPERLDPPGLQRWVAMMATNHPSLVAAEARVRAARLDAEGRRLVADPQFQMAGTIYSPKGMEAYQQGNLLYGVEQPLPVLGKEQAARTVARRVADTEALRAITRFQELQRDLSVALFRAALARRAIELAHADQVRMGELVHSLEAQLASGSVSPVEVLRAQTELARRRVDVENLRSQEAEALASVNRRLGRDPGSSLPRFDLPDPPAAYDLSEGLVQRALENAPRRRLLESERLEAGAVVEATRRSARPDLALGIQGMQFDGDGEFRSGTFGLLLNLPIWNRGNYRKDLARDRQRLKVIEEEQSDAALAVREELHHLVLQLSAARRGGRLHEGDILPKADDSHRTALAQWTAGRGALRDVMESNRILLDARLQVARANAEQWVLLSEIVLLCGLPNLEALAPYQTPAEALPQSPSSPP